MARGVEFVDRSIRLKTVKEVRLSLDSVKEEGEYVLEEA